ncbi:MAG: phosphatase domain-containing protein [Caldilineaceae bacterium]
MKNWQKLFGGLIGDADHQLERLVDRLQKSFAAEPIYIQPYLGYGTPETLYVRGRVLAGEQLEPASEDDTLWENLVATYRRFETDEVAHARVQAQFGTIVTEVVADKEGYFVATVRPPIPLNEVAQAAGSRWVDVTVSILPPIATTDAEVEPPVYETNTQVMVPPDHSNFGVISDLDDTVLQTNAASLLQAARITFLQNARTRMPFAGVAQFYQALQHGPLGTAQNPIFYVSSSPWNLYDLLMDFLQFHEIPHGPLFLRDIGFRRDLLSASSHHGHKLAQVEHLLAVYPDLPFILIGDSGQEDPEIYREAVRRFPNRIAAIYIRDVSLDQRDVEIDALIQEVGTENVPMLRAADTVAAAEHAAATGFISETALPTIRNGNAVDKSL